MTPPISIDGTDITGATIDGQEVQEITVDGQTVFTATAGPAGLILDLDPSGFDGTDWTDSVGGELFSGSGTSALATGSFNGKDAVDFQSSAAFTSGFGFTPPYAIIFVHDLTYDGNLSTMWSEGDTSPQAYTDFDGIYQYEIRGGGNSVRADHSTGQLITTFFYDGTTGFIRENGAILDSLTTDAASISSLVISNTSRRFLEGLVARIQVFDASASGFNVSDAENSLASEYGLSI